MGYRTWVTMEVKDSGTMTKEETRKAFTKMCEKADLMSEELNTEDLQTAGEDNNGCSLETFVQESKKYPELLLEGSVDGTSEDSEDQRKVRIRNGQIETVMAEITYEPFEKLLTAQEKRNRQPVLEQLNKVEIIGVVGLVRTQTLGNRTCLHLSVLTEYAYKDKDANAVIESTWHNVCAWENENRPDTTDIAKGDYVHITGRLRMSRYTDASGCEKSYPEIIASKIEKVSKAGAQFED